jgi:cytochrome c biogenesis protein
MIPELRGTEKIFNAHDSTGINLGFTLRNDSFGIEFYDNGMPKEYKSSLTVLENNQEILKKDIKVNSPLTYKGITFYQSSYQAHQEFIIQATDTVSQKSRRVSLPFQQQMVLEELKLQLGIINAEAAGQRAVRAKVWIKIGDDPPQSHWVNNNESISINGDGKNYTLNVKQLYSTGLQVAKDPGVWIVYAGCALMLIGLYIAFFLSHRKIWLYQKTINNKKMVILAGTTNKNKASFAKKFAELENVINQALDHHNHKNQ